MRKGILYIFILLSSWSLAQVDTLSLADIPTKKCLINKFPVKWELLDFKPPIQQASRTLTDIQPRPYPDIKTVYLGKPEFEEFFPEDIIKKKLSKDHQRDVATMDIQYLDKKHGLPSSIIYVMERDLEGNILFNSEGTLNTYDGQYLTSYYFNDSIGVIRHISARNHAKKWIASTSGVYYQLGKSFFRLKNNWGTSFWRAVKDDKDILWMTSFNKGIHFIRNDSLFQMINDEIKIDSKEIIRDKKDQIWIACVPGVIRINATDTVLYRIEPATRQACSIIEFEDEIYVGLFRKGMHVIKDNRVWNLDLGINGKSPFDFEVNEKGLWFTVFGEGLQLLQSDGTYYKFNEKDGLAAIWSHTLTADNFGNIWVGDLQRGLSIFSVANFKPNKSLSRPYNIMAVHEISDTAWFFYTFGEPIRKVGNRFYQMQLDPEIALEGYHYNGSFIHADKLWLQACHRGLIHYNNNMAYSYEYTDDPQDKGNHQLSLDKFGRLWAVNFRKELRYFVEDSLHLCYESISNENACLNVNQLVIDEEQEFYFSKQSEIFWVQKEQLYRHSFSDEYIKYIFKHPEMGIWVLTDKGILQLIKDRITRYFEFELPKHSKIKSALAIRDCIHLITNEGFWNLKLTDNNLTFNKVLGNSNLEEARLFQYQNELMLSGRYFNHYYKPWWNLKKEYKPKLSITGVKINDIETNSQDQIHLKPDTKILFEIGYLDWGKNRQLQYQLIRDAHPIKWSDFLGNALEFENLSPGSYQLRVRATNQSNEWVESSRKFNVAPFWYESQWFYFILIGLLLLAFYFIYKLRVRTATILEQKLKIAVEQKTGELANEKKQVEKQLRQKELLLKEVNHRVMNNMQMVSSILELQNGNTGNAEIREHLEKASDRIKALALAHQHLYKNDSYETINIKKYLNVIKKSLKLDNNIQISLRIPPDLKLPIEQAQSLGLVLNELISNSLKHAWTDLEFSAQKTGQLPLKQILVELKELESAYLWVYEDNGKGILAIEIGNNGLGTTLISAITARQLSGTLNYDLKDGFRMTIKFPKR